MNSCTVLSSWTPKRRSTRGPAARPMAYAQASPITAQPQATASTSGRLKCPVEPAAAADASSSTISPEEGRPKLSPNAPAATPK